MKAPGHATHRSTAPWPMLFSLMCNGIAPNRIGRRSQEVVEARLDNFVAFFLLMLCGTNHRRDKRLGHYNLKLMYYHLSFLDDDGRETSWRILRTGFV